jgi:hypothetical protein
MLCESVKADFSDRTPNQQAALVMEEFVLDPANFNALTQSEMDDILAAALAA